MTRFSILFIICLSLTACSGVPGSRFFGSMFLRSNDVGLTEAQSCAIGYDLSKQVYDRVKIRETVLIPVKNVKNSCEKYMVNFLRRAGYSLDETGLGLGIKIDLERIDDITVFAAASITGGLKISREYELVRAGVIPTSAVSILQTTLPDGSL